MALSHLARCQAVALILPSGAAISGASAACALGADLAGTDTPVEVSVPPHKRMSARRGISVHYGELAAGDIVQRAGIAVTSAVRTAFDLARRGPLVEAVVGLDALLQVSALEPEAIAEYAAAGRAGWRGVRRLGAVLALAARGAESPMETRLRLALITAGLPRPDLQHRVLDRTGRVVARLDLAYPAYRLGIEYDGDSHWDPRAVRKDLRRQNALRALGWSLLRFTADDVVHNQVRLVKQVVAALA
ncbi:MAG: DUF559 domain-containing protein [Candidatus Dormibacteraeota bacterium]|nr:DUF559 domain-containing protein [Candidatus Dormibacteraeota bacterium]